MTRFIFILLFSLFFAGCASLQNHAKYQLVDGRYNIKWQDKKYKTYIQNVSDSIITHEAEINIHNSIRLSTQES